MEVPESPVWNGVSQLEDVLRLHPDSRISSVAIRDGMLHSSPQFTS
jgi:hypothetical protein